MGKFQTKKTASGGFVFNLLAGNGQVVATSEVYNKLGAPPNRPASAQRNAPAAGVADQTVENPDKMRNPKFEDYADKAGKTRFRLKAANGQVIAVGEAYETKKAALAGVASVKKNAPGAKVVEA